MNEHDDNTERRSVSAIAELRIAHGDADESPKIVGYAAVFDKPTEIMGSFSEVVRAGAFADSLSGGADVRALVDHNPSKILGRISAGTLTVSEDKKGLRVSIDPPDTTAGRDIVESIKRGDVSGMSFQFDAIEDLWGTKKGKPFRELIRLDLIDVSVVTFPAYPKATVGVRSLERWQEEHKIKISMPNLRKRLELEAIR